MTKVAKETEAANEPQLRQHGAKLLRLSHVLARTSLGKTLVYELISRGNFPAPVKVGRSSRWREEEVDDWIQSLRKAA